MVFYGVLGSCSPILSGFRLLGFKPWSHRFFEGFHFSGSPEVFAFTLMMLVFISTNYS